MKKFWIYLNPDTFIWAEKEKAIVYNSLNGKSYAYEMKEELKLLTHALQTMENLYCVEKDENEMTENIHIWVENVTTISAGGMREAGKNLLEKPICFYPILNLQGEVTRLNEKKASINYNLLNYLHEVTIHTEGVPGNNYYKQFVYPYASTHTIKPEMLKYFCSQLTGLHVPRLNLCGKNIIGYLENNSAVLLKKIFGKITIYMLSNELSNDTIDYMTACSENFNFRIICHAQEIKRLNPACVASVCQNQRIHFYFLLESEEDGTIIEEFISTFSPPTYTIRPVYNGANYSFFKKNVFLTEDDISAIHLKKREIFAHQALNENFFGKLIITPEGNIYSDLNLPPLGTVYDSIYDLIEKELTNIISWRRVRDNAICSDCIYQWLCPSPSNYETVLNQPNLCSLK